MNQLEEFGKKKPSRNLFKNFFFLFFCLFFSLKKHLEEHPKFIRRLSSEQWANYVITNKHRHMRLHHKTLKLFLIFQYYSAFVSKEGSQSWPAESNQNWRVKWVRVPMRELCRQLSTTSFLAHTYPKMPWEKPLKKDAKICYLLSASKFNWTWILLECFSQIYKFHFFFMKQWKTLCQIPHILEGNIQQGQQLFHGADSSCECGHTSFYCTGCWFWSSLPSSSIE